MSLREITRRPGNCAQQQTGSCHARAMTDTAQMGAKHSHPTPEAGYKELQPPPPTPRKHMTRGPSTQWGWACGSPECMGKSTEDLIQAKLLFCFLNGRPTFSLPSAPLTDPFSALRNPVFFLASFRVLSHTRTARPY